MTSDETIPPAGEEGAPAQRQVRVLQGFAYEEQWFVPGTPSDVVTKVVPMDILELHKATGFVAMADPITPGA